MSDQNLPFYEPTTPPPGLDNPTTPTGARPPRELVRRINERQRHAAHLVDTLEELAKGEGAVSVHYVLSLARGLSEGLERDAALALAVAEVSS